MARPIRIEQAGGWYHLTARGNELRPIYRDPRDRRLAKLTVPTDFSEKTLRVSDSVVD